MGHGGGEAYVDKKDVGLISKDFVNLFLFGCSSGKLVQSDKYNFTGNPLTYYNSSY